MLRCSAAGHDVRWFRFMKPGQHRRDGEGMTGFRVVSDWREHMAWAREGLIFCTGNSRYLQELDRWREHGYKIFAPTVQSAALEIDRGKGMDAMRAAGIDLPPYETFSSLQDAEAFARKSDRAWVFKVLDGSNEDKALTYVASDPADLVGWLRRRIAEKRKIGNCMLQEKVDVAFEIGVSAWAGPDGFLPDKYNVCWEHKKLMSGENGPNTGEQGTVALYAEKEKLADEMLLPLEPIVRTLGHRGDFAIGAVVDTKGKPHFLEMTARVGCPIWFLQMAAHKGDPAQWMRDLLDGKDSLKVSYDVEIGVVCAQPRYPYDDNPGPEVEGNPISGITGLDPDVHLISAMLGKGPMMKGNKVVDGPVYQTSGCYVLVATALGKTIEQARSRVYGTIGEIGFSNMMFRDDIGEKVIKVLPEMKKFGYATDLSI